MFLILVLGDIVMRIPMAALVGVMIMVSVGTFDWRSIIDLRKVPAADSVVMVATVATVVYTHDLAKGVAVGVVLGAIIFGWRIARLAVAAELLDCGSKRYSIQGQLFFATCSDFGEFFDAQTDPDRVEIDFSGSHVWDHSAVAAIARVITKYSAAGKQVVITGLNSESQRLVDRVGLAAPSGH